MNEMTIAWLVLFIAFLVIEFATMALTTIWFAGGSLAAFAFYLMGFSIITQILVFAAVSILLLLLIRPAVRRYYQNNETKTNAESLIGQKAVVVSRIDNLEAEGKVMVNGMEWTARALEEEGQIEKGTVVLIRKIEGVKLIVEPEERKVEEQT